MAFCAEAAEWLDADLSNVVAVHCKAGKGRTGVMVCALLLWRGECSDPASALEYYARERTHNGKGVTIPSQIRYIIINSIKLHSNRWYIIWYIIK